MNFLKKILEKSQMRTVPQIFFGEDLIGGYTELSDLDKVNSFQDLKCYECNIFVNPRALMKF